MIKEKHLDPELRARLQSGTGNEHYIFAAGSASESLYSSKVPTGFKHNTITAAHAAMTTGQCDVAYLSPDSHSQAAGITWSLNNSALIGQAFAGMHGMRSRIGHSANFDALLTVSGYGNLFKNIYLMHGRGSATNLHCIEVTGDRNVFQHCHFAGPLHATEAATAGYSVLELTGAAECWFDHCTFGVNTTARSAANTILRLGAGSGTNVFENCIFSSMSSDTDPIMIEVLVGLTSGWTLFKSCTFINFSANWAKDLVVAATISCAVQQHKLIFTPDCNFIGITDVVDVTKESSVLFCSVPAVNTSVVGAIGVGLPLNPDVS